MLIRNDDRWLDSLSHPSAEVVTFTHFLHTASPGFGFVDREINQHVLNLVVSGGFMTEFEGTRHALGPGALLWIGAGVKHSFSYLPGSQHLQMINFRFALRQGLREISFECPGFVRADAGALRGLCELMHKDVLRNHPRRMERCKRFLYLLFTDLMETACCGEGARLNSDQCIRIIDHVHRRIDQRFTPAELASVAGLSTDYFRRIFHRTFGCSPRHWLLKQRMHQAANLLANGETVTGAAMALGYGDIYLFSRQFKGVMGTAPSRYRA